MLLWCHGSRINIATMLSVALQAFLPQLGLDLTLKGKPGKILSMSSIYGSYTLPFSVRRPATPSRLTLTPHMLWDAANKPHADVVAIHAMLGGLCCALPAAAVHNPGLGMHAVGLLGQQGRPECAV